MPKQNKKSTKTNDIKIDKNLTRKIKQPNYKSFRLSNRLKQPKGPLKNSFKLFLLSLKLLKKNWRLYGGIVLVYLILTVTLVKGFGISTNINEQKAILQDAIGSNGSEVNTGFALFGVLLKSITSASSEIAKAYQSMLLIIVSLVLIWTLRQTHNKNKLKITVKDAYYKGLTPTIPFVIVLMVIGLQLLPLVISTFLYKLVFGAGLATTPIEQALWAILLFSLLLLSLYMITSSVFALYIVTLPEVMPMQALRSARELVRFRRWVILRKLLFLPFSLLIIAIAIMVPLIIVVPIIAEWVFFALSMLALAVVHSYMYGLYRELLKNE